MRLSARAGAGRAPCPVGAGGSRAPAGAARPPLASPVAVHSSGQKGEGIYFDYEPVDDAPTNPKLLEIGGAARAGPGGT
jgi:hypothetical protein